MLGNVSLIVEPARGSSAAGLSRRQGPLRASAAQAPLRFSLGLAADP